MLHCHLKEAILDSSLHHKHQPLQLMLRSRHSADLNLLGVVLPLTHQEDGKAGRQDSCHHGHAQHQEQVPCSNAAADPLSGKLRRSGMRIYLLNRSAALSGSMLDHMCHILQHARPNLEAGEVVGMGQRPVWLLTLPDLRAG